MGTLIMGEVWKFEHLERFHHVRLMIW